MKVKELIKQLKGFKKNDEIVFDAGANFYDSEITEQKLYSENKTYVQICITDFV